jgi:hypothetical protein
VGRQKKPVPDIAFYLNPTGLGRVRGSISIVPSIGMMSDEGDYRYMLPALERIRIRNNVELEGGYSRATCGVSCLLAGHLFLHLLLHFLGCGLCNVGSDHPGVTLGIYNGSTAVAPKHIHHGSLGRCAEL